MVSEFGRVEKTIYREMVSSVKEVNVKGVKLVRRAFVRGMKRSAVQSELRLTRPQPQSHQHLEAIYLPCTCPKVSSAHVY
jgi:hypothetical protein